MMPMGMLYSLPLCVQKTLTGFLCTEGRISYINVGVSLLARNLGCGRPQSVAAKMFTCVFLYAREELEKVGVRADLKRHIADLMKLEASGQLTIFDNEDDTNMVGDNQEHTYGTLPFDTKPII